MPRSAARGSVARPIVKLRSTAGTGCTYATRKNRRNDADRLTLRKDDPRVRRHVEFRENADPAGRHQHRPRRRPSR